MLLKEFCAENFTDIPKAIARGAHRIELCDNLVVGGTTVSSGVMKETIDYCHQQDVPVMVIIRPRSGSFIYHDTELKMMYTDIVTAKKYGADGVVIGCLDKNNWLDERALTFLLKASEGLQVTFHMAFDQMTQPQQFHAVDWLVSHGVQRILTHGGLPTTPIKNNLPHLKELVAYANNRLLILPGGGITHENCQRVASYLGVSEIHGTKIIDLS